MARRSRTSPSAYSSVNRYRPAVPRLAVRSFRPLRAVSVQDGRAFHPLGPFRPLHASPRAAARVVVRSPARAWSRPEILGFAVPSRVRKCVQRSERREVLFAKRLTRRGAGSSKRRNYWSSISCK